MELYNTYSSETNMANYQKTENTTKLYLPRPPLINPSKGTFLLEHLCSHTDSTSKRLSVESESQLSFHIVEISAVISICIGDTWDLGWKRKKTTPLLRL